MSLWADGTLILSLPPERQALDITRRGLGKLEASQESQ